MFVALGFVLASLCGLLLAPPLWRRAVRLTTRKLEATMPMSIADIQADKDQMRAEFAMKLRRVEIALEKAKGESARLLVERNRHRTAAHELENTVKRLEATLNQRGNEVTLLERSMRERPDFEAQLDKAREIITSRDKDLQTMKGAFAKQREALDKAKRAVMENETEIVRLKAAIEEAQQAAPARGSRRTSKTTAKSNGLAAENKRLVGELLAAKTELEALKDKETKDNALLKREMKQLADDIMRAAPAETDDAAAKVVPGKPAEKPAAKTVEKSKDNSDSRTPSPVKAHALASDKASGAPDAIPASANTNTKTPAKKRKQSGRTPRKSLTERLKHIADS